MKKKREKKRSGGGMTSKRRREHKGAGGGFCYSPPELPQFLPKEEEEYRLDIVPFVAGKGNPYAPKPGELYYERTYFQHPNIGPSKMKVVCNLEMYKEPCFICEFRAKMGKKPGERTEASKKAFTELLPKQRQIFLVRNRGEMKKGLQFMDQSWHVFGKFLDNKLKAAKGEQRKIRDNFAEPDGGSTLVITGNKKSAGEGSFVELSDIQFEPRDKPLKEELLEAAPCLDDCFSGPADYEETKKLFLQSQGEEDDEEDEDEETDNEEWDAEDEEDEESDEEKDEDDEEDDEEEESEDEDDDDEDEEEDEDSEGPPCKKGNRVLFKYKGEKVKGTVVKVIENKEMVRVKSKKREQPHNLEYDEILKVL